MPPRKAAPPATSPPGIGEFAAQESRYANSNGRHALRMLQDGKALLQFAARSGLPIALNTERTNRLPRYYVGPDGKRVQFTRPTDLSRLSDEMRKRMRKDSQIILGMGALKAPILSAFSTYAIECENAEIAAFIRTAIDPILNRTIRSGLNSLDFGNAPHEKVFITRNIRYDYEDKQSGESVSRTRAGAVVYREMKDLDPQRVTYYADPKTGQFVGFMHDSDEKQFVEPEGAWVTTHEREFGDIYGTSVLDACYEPWYWCSVINMFCLRYFERKGDPPIKGRAPAFTMSDNGTEKSSVDFFNTALTNLISAGVLTLPAEYDEHGNLLWDADYMKDDQRGEMFLRYIEYLQMLKLRALMIPDGAIQQSGRTGSFAASKAFSEMFMTTRAQDLEEILESLNRWVIPQLVEYNFGADAPPATITATIRPSDREELILRIVTSLLRAESVAGTDRTLNLIDAMKALEQLNIPITSPEKVARAQEKREQEIQADRELRERELQAKVQRQSGKPTEPNPLKPISTDTTQVKE